jgi:hypothetical protein
MKAPEDSKWLNGHACVPIKTHACVPVRLVKLVEFTNGWSKEKTKRSV